MLHLNRLIARKTYNFGNMSVTTEKIETITPVETVPESKAIQHQIVIVGGGAAGITVAAQLLTRNKVLDITIIEPSDKHYYQPGWTLVGEIGRAHV